MIPLEFGEAIRAARKGASLTLEALSERTKPHIDISTLSRIENGHRDFRISLLPTIAKALGTTSEALLAAAQVRSKPTRRD